MTSRTSWMSCTSLQEKRISLYICSLFIFCLCLLTKWTLSARQVPESCTLCEWWLSCSPPWTIWTIGMLPRKFNPQNASHLQHCKRVTFAPKVGWAEALGFYDLDHQVANIFHLVEGVCQSLENNLDNSFFMIASIFTHIALFKLLLPFGVRVPVG